MQQATAKPAKPYAEVLSAINSKVSPKWDDGALAIYDSMEALKEEGYLTRWNSASLKSRPVNQGELKRQLKTDKNLDELLGLIGEVQDADLKQLTVVGNFLVSFFEFVTGNGVSARVDRRNTLQT